MAAVARALQPRRERLHHDPRHPQAVDEDDVAHAANCARAFSAGRARACRAILKFALMRTTGLPSTSRCPAADAVRVPGVQDLRPRNRASRRACVPARYSIDRSMVTKFLPWPSSPAAAQA